MTEEQVEIEEAPIGRRCYVGNLAWRTSWQDLKDAFRECGTVVYANVMQDQTGTLGISLRIVCSCCCGDICESSGGVQVAPRVGVSWNSRPPRRCAALTLPPR